MLSSRFLVVSFLYVFYATGVVAVDVRDPFGGGNPLCQNVQTVTVTRTVTPGQPSSSSSSRPANNNIKSSSLPVVTTRPGNVNLATSTSVNKNTKTSSIKTRTSTSSVNTITSSVKNVNTKNVKSSTKNVNSSTKNVKTNTNTKNVNTSTKINVVNTSSTKSVNTNTKNVNTKTSSVLSSSTGLPSTSLPPVSSTGLSLAVSPSSTAAPPANTGDPSTSLTLDPSVIQNIDGKGQATGEADSLVSTNDFIGFCVGKTITNGKQVQTGSCNPVPMGDIPSVDNMPSAKFNSPKNFDTIAANTPFTISLQVRNFGTGTFTNAANTYYAAPQQLVGGVIKGHSHVTVQKMASLGATDPLNPKVFDFFKGLNAAAVNGVLTADVTKGLPAGVYRISSINSAGNHQEALGPVAQRGSFNDVVYITVTEGGTNANSVSSPAVDPTATGVSSDVLSSTVSPPVSSPVVKGGKDTVVSSSVNPPVSTSGGGKNGGQGGNVVSTSPALPKSTPPPAVSGKKNTVVSSSAKPPASTPAKGTPGGNGNGGGNKQNPKRMHKRSAHA